MTADMLAAALWGALGLLLLVLWGVAAAVRHADGQRRAARVLERIDIAKWTAELAEERSC